jgi:hypothetical protein
MVELGGAGLLTAADEGSGETTALGDTVGAPAEPGVVLATGVTLDICAAAEMLSFLFVASA